MKKINSQPKKASLGQATGQDTEHSKQDGGNAAGKLKAIEKAIDIKRQQLYNAVDCYGLSNPRCLRYSMELDELINTFNSVRKSMQKDN
ncbi:MAG: Spo0E like sporulation regulatory protein [Paenibacillus sp.]|nr:Spo0E like sporulation regulatory protein [Paenibacillus sp.]